MTNGADQKNKFYPLWHTITVPLWIGQDIGPFSRQGLFKSRKYPVQIGKTVRFVKACVKYYSSCLVPDWGFTTTWCGKVFVASRKRRSIGCSIRNTRFVKRKQVYIWRNKLKFSTSPLVIFLLLIIFIYLLAPLLQLGVINW